MPAVTADSVIVELEAKTAEYDRAISTSGQAIVKFGSDAQKGASQAEGAMVGSLKRIGSESGNANSSQLILQSVIRRTTDQFAAGAPLATIFAEHIGALAEAGELAGGSMGKLGALLQGPLGLALSAAASIAAILAQKFFEAGNEADTHAKKVRTLADAIKDLNEISNKDIVTESQRIAASAAEVIALGQREIATKALTKAKLESALADAQAAKASNVPGAPSYYSTGAAEVGAEAKVDALKSQIAQINKELSGTTIALRNSAAAITRDNVAAGLDKAKQAVATYGGAERALLEQYRSGAITLAEYAAKEEQLQKTRDAGTKKTRDGRAAADELAEANAKLATATNEVQRAEARVELVRAHRASLTPAAYQAELTAAEGAVNAAKAHEAQLRLDTKAAEEFSKATNQLTLDLLKTNAAMSRGLLPDADKETKSNTDELDKAQKSRVDTMGAAIEAQQRQQEEGIRTLAGLYYDLFSGGTKSVWKDFERMGLEALAKLAAQKTFGAIAGAVSGSPFLASIFHLAGGGVFDVGGNGGVDRNVLSINGVPRAAVSANEKIAVVPQGKAVQGAGDRGGGTTIINAPQFNLAGAVVTEDLYADMQRISDQSAAQMGVFASQAGAMGGVSEVKRQAARPALPRSLG